MKILIVNPGSTSTKIGIFNEKLVFEKVLRHDTEELKVFESVFDQYEFRLKLIQEALDEAGEELKSFAGIVGMGGLLKPISGGVYLINEAILSDLKNATYGEHASNLGAILAYELARVAKVPSYIVDPVGVDEFCDIARISGNKKVVRRSIFHALNQKAIARMHAEKLGKKYNELSLVVAHLGGGISIGLHKNGEVIDAVNALDGEGPFTPERSGGLAALAVAQLCFFGDYTFNQIKKMLIGEGGFNSYFGTNNVQEIVQRAEGEAEVKTILDAFIYQISKEIAALSTLENGKIDGILLTGGIAYNSHIVAEITKRVGFISNVFAYPGEDELSALAKGALRALKGEEEAKIYI